MRPPNAVGPNGQYYEIQVSDDGIKHLIPLEDVLSGGPPKDGIPSIDNPQFVGSDEWDDQDFLDDMLVIGVEVSGSRRAYPFQVLVWHEITNDVFNGVPLLVTYCPLCGTGIVFVRELEGVDEPVEFGVSGKLYNSNLLMYDRMTETLWSQQTGTAVVGELTGQRLEFYPSQIMTWADWKTAYPESEVLTRETGFNRDYDDLPYAGYDQSPSIWFQVRETDDRLFAKELVTGVELDGETFGAYPDTAVIEHGPVNDVLGDTPLLVVADPKSGNNVVVFIREVAGQILTFSTEGAFLVDEETATKWDYSGLALEGALIGEQLTAILGVKGMWFSWYAFNPETELWQPDA